MSSEYSLTELAQSVRTWCSTHQVQPANGQVSESVSERTIRYYRTLGLLDAPAGAYLRTFTEKHRLQLLAICIYQAQGLPLRRIQEQLYGKSESELLAFTRSAGKQLQQTTPVEPIAPTERWGVTPLTDDLLIISRQGRPLPINLIRRLQKALTDAGWPGTAKPE